MKYSTSTADAVSNGVTPETITASVSNEEYIQNIPDVYNENTSRDMCVPLPEVGRSDEPVRSDVNNSVIQSNCNISEIRNKAPSDKNGNDDSIMQTVESNVMSNAVTLNVSRTVSEGSICVIDSERQNEFEVTAAGSKSKENAPSARAEDESLINQSSLASSSTEIDKNVQSEDRVYKRSECSPRRLSQEIKNADVIEESAKSVVDSEYSKTEKNYFNSDGTKTNSVLPEYLNVLLEGMDVCGDSRCPVDSKPEWVDLGKFRTGQRIAMKYLFGLVLAEMLSLMMILSYPNGLQPLIFTGKSNTPFKSFKRYLSTVIRVRSWYSEDIWEPGTEGHKNIKAVRAMHETVRQELHKTKPDEFLKRSTLTGNCKFVCKEAAIWSPLHERIREDFQRSCLYPSPEQRPFLTSKANPVFVNQMDMALTQFGFVGLFVLFPGKFGAHGICDEELDSFVHLWRCLGYVLGLEDRYNLCNGDLETVRQRSRDIIHFWMKPNLRDVSRDWEHMTRCVVEGINYYIPGITFETSLLYLCGILGIYAPRISAALTFKQKLLYQFMTFTFCVLLRLPGAPSFFNWLMSLAVRLAQVASPEKLRKFEQRKYPYEENATCTKL
ncbi:hypothetical protein B7P43_G13578 [Cryptotermes secundus]|uniref:Uncharacterized protein n=1 Tax=Cryptotermes secundus TaxID=105785 RepID=A0A2J7PPW3_9NEOP|nr:uncharacterized protein LOC111872567 [Cryptotermes secundus]XP_023722381.1 uncharacterized protein LOC111872567 [Cryptotermes secundus]PNF18365.1 hypothetical protein B7P43_G13578 [Cryptotermes secundus]